MINGGNEYDEEYVWQYICLGDSQMFLVPVVPIEFVIFTK